MTPYSVFPFLRGPDQIKPANNFFTWKPDGLVKLRSSIDKSSDDDGKYISVPTQLKLTASMYPERVAIRYKVDETIRDVTFREYQSTCRIVAKAFLKLGLQRYHAVGILGYNAPEWIYSAVGTILAGGFEAGIYSTSSPDACLHYLNLSRANIVVVENDFQLQKILTINHKLTELKTIIQYTGKPTIDGVYSWDDILTIGQDESDDNLENVLKTIAINECCVLVFTSGTTGLPKAVMLSHDNILHGARSACNVLCTDGGNETRSLSYLPMNHTTSQLTDIFMPIIYGSSTFIADRNCLKNTLVDNLKACRPTFLVGVPRVWEKLMDQLTSYEAACNIFSRWIISSAKLVTLEHHKNLNKIYHLESILLYKLFQCTIFKTLKSTVGLECCNRQVITSAPSLSETLDYFTSLDTPLINIYGMSEASGIIIAEKVRNDIMQVKILNPDAEGNGEVSYSGRGVFMGYLHEEQKTLETIEPDGWIHSGDIGALNDKFEIKISGRIKELVITAGGENILAPLIENSVKANVPVISQAVVIGDKRKYLTMLITLKSEIDLVTEIPSDKLAEETKEWYRALGFNFDTVTEVINDKNRKVYEAIQDGIYRTNAKAISNAHKVQKFHILPRDFSVATEELNASLKLKRFFIHQKYADVINEMYHQ